MSRSRRAYEQFFRGAEKSAPLSFAAIKDEKPDTADTTYDKMLNTPLFETPPDLGNPGEGDHGFDQDFLGKPDDRFQELKTLKPGEASASLEYDETTDNIDKQHTVNKGLPDGTDSTAWDDTSQPVQDPAPDPHFFQQSECKMCGRPDCRCDQPEYGKSSDSQKGFSNDGRKTVESDMSFKIDAQRAAGQLADEITRELVCRLFGSPLLAYYQLHDISHGAWTQPESTFLQRAAQWSREYVAKLPDTAFACVEPGRAARHLPWCDPTKSGNEVAHLQSAIARIEQVAPVSNALTKESLQSQARARLTAASAKLGVGEQEKESVMASTTPPAGQNVKPKPGPLDPYTFPKTAPSPEGDTYSPPGSVKVPGNTSNETYKEQDSTVFVEERKHDEFSPEPGIKTPGTDAPTPTVKEQKDSTFPGHAAPGSGQKFKPNAKASLEEGHAPDGDPGEPPPEQSQDLNRKVAPGPQPPETERHQPYLHKEQEEAAKKPADKKPLDKKKPVVKKKAAPAPPWDKKKKKAMKAFLEGSDVTTPGMDIEKSSEEPDGDEHVDAIEKCALITDLYARRFASYGRGRDLQAQADSFASTVDAMDEMSECGGHDEEEKAYSKELLAYSFGQLQRSVKHAMRNFAEDEEEPDVKAYSALLTMRASLDAVASRHFAGASFSYQMAEWMAGEEMGDAVADDMASTPPPDGQVDDCKAEEMADEATPDHGEGEDEMKEADVSAAIKIASQLQEAGLINGVAAFAETTISLARMSPKDRQNWVAMTQNVSGQPLANNPSPARPTFGPSNNRASATTVESNMVATGSKNTVGGKAQPQQASRMLGVFMNGTKAPLKNKQ